MAKKIVHARRLMLTVGRSTEGYRTGARAGFLYVWVSVRGRFLGVAFR